MSSRREGHEEEEGGRSKRRKSRSRERRRSKERSPESRKKKKRSTAWDDPSIPSIGPIAPILPSQLGFELSLTSSLPLSQIYVGNVTFGITEEEIKFVFERCGPVKNVQLIKDPDSHKAYSFVEYDTHQAAELALTTMDGYELAGRKLKVGRPMNPTPIRNSLQPSTPAIFPAMLGSDDSVAVRHGLPILPNMKWGEPGEPCPPPKYPLKAGPKVYACGLPAKCDMDYVRALFSTYGVIKSVELGEKDKCHYALLEFMSESATERAITKLHGHEINGLKIKVGRILPSPLSPAAVLSQLANAPAPTVLQQESIEDNTLLSGGSARMNLMRKLMRGEQEPAVFKQFTSQDSSSNMPINPLAAAALSVVQAGLSSAPTRCVVLKNLVGSPVEVDDELGEEVRDECSKYGKVEHLLIYDEANPVTKAVEVFIFVLYTDLEGSFRATNKLNNRFFARRRIVCNYFDERAFRRLMES